MTMTAAHPALAAFEGETGVADQLLAHIRRPRLDIRHNAVLRARVMQSAGQSPDTVISHDAAAFRPYLDGIAVRVLRCDRAANSQTSLWRLQPGAVIPGHDHVGEEECLILEGRVCWGDAEYGAGDYLLARPGARHAQLVSPQGALMLVRSELNERLAELFG